MSYAYDLTKKLKSIKNTILQVAPIEAKTKEATSSSGVALQADKQEIAEATYNYDDCRLVMGVIWKRINDTGKQYKHILKGLQLLEYLIIHGSERVIEEARDNSYTLRTLKTFRHIDENGRDVGSGIRSQAERVIELLKDDKKLNAVREKAKKDQEKYQGFSRSEARYRQSSLRDRDQFVSRFSDKYKDDDEEEKKEEEDEEKKEEAEEEEEDKNKEEEGEETPTPIQEPDEPKKVSRPRAPSLKVSPKKEDIFDIFSGSTQQQQSDPFKTDPFGSDPFKTDPFKTDPFKTDSFKTDPFGSDPFKSDPFSSTTNSQTNNVFDPRGTTQQQDTNQGDWAKFEDTNFQQTTNNQQNNQEKQTFENDDFQFVKAEEEKKDDLFDFTKNLVDLSLTGKKPQQQVQQPPKTLDGKKVTLNSMTVDEPKQRVLPPKTFTAPVSKPPTFTPPVMRPPYPTGPYHQGPYQPGLYQPGPYQPGPYQQGPYMNRPPMPYGRPPYGNVPPPNYTNYPQHFPQQ